MICLNDVVHIFRFSISIAFADEVLHGLQLGSLRILAGGFVSKGSVQGQPFELANLVLIQRADAQVADLLAFRRPTRSSGPRCPNRLFNLPHHLYDNSGRNGDRRRAVNDNLGLQGEVCGILLLD